MPKSAIVIGAGIAGLATARALAVRGYEITVIERTNKAVGASVRNFGMIWPIGQPTGELYERSLISRNIWKQVCKDAHIWHEETGSLHLAHRDEEWTVLQEFNELESSIRKCRLLSASETLEMSASTVSKGLRGGLYSEEEIIIDPREAVVKIAAWLSEKYAVQFVWGKAITEISYPCVYSGKEQFEADEVYLCNGADFETLYPEIFSASPLTKCKLQMLRFPVQPNGWRLGPPLCGGLTLIHYKSFSNAPSLPALRKVFETDYADHLKWGIHVMVAQNEAGEIAVGDSHEYALTHDPFDKHFLYKMILDYLKTFARFPDETIIQTWNGIYPKLLDGGTDLILQPEAGVTIVGGLGGAGMTMAFGLCEQILGKRAG